MASTIFSQSYNQAYRRFDLPTQKSVSEMKASVDEMQARISQNFADANRNWQIYQPLSYTWNLKELLRRRILWGKRRLFYIRVSQAILGRRETYLEVSKDNPSYVEQKTLPIPSPHMLITGTGSHYASMRPQIEASRTLETLYAQPLPRKWYESLAKIVSTMPAKELTYRNSETVILMLISGETESFDDSLPASILLSLLGYDEAYIAAIMSVIESKKNYWV